jgi:hypothetical protein
MLADEAVVPPTADEFEPFENSLRITRRVFATLPEFLIALRMYLQTCPDWL